MKKFIFLRRFFARRFLNELTDGASTSSCVDLFHLLIDRCDKQYSGIFLKKNIQRAII